MSKHFDDTPTLTILSYKGSGRVRSRRAPQEGELVACYIG